MLTALTAPLVRKPPSLAPPDVCVFWVPADAAAAGALMPPGGLCYRTFPPLILSECCALDQRATGPGVRKRSATSSRHKRPSAGRRRAVSELMVRGSVAGACGGCRGVRQAQCLRMSCATALPYC
jgi:hypothetical protein